MATVIFILILISLYHFIVEILLLPILRFNITCKLSIQRDRLHILKIKHKADINHKTFSALNSYICTIANNQDRFKLFDFLFSNKQKTHSFNRETEEFIETLESLENHKIKELNEIFQASSKLGVKTMVNNSLGWAIYVFPLLIVMFIVALILSIFSKHFSTLYNIVGKKQDKMVNIAAENRGNPLFENGQSELRNWVDKSNRNNTLVTH